MKKKVGYYIFLLKKHGVFGRKAQVQLFLSLERDDGYNLNKNRTEQLYQKLRQQYREIRVHRLWSTRIGEYITRYLLAVEDAKKNKEKGILDVFILTDCVNDNSRLTKIMGRNIQLVDDTNIGRWSYILQRFPKVEFVKSWQEYNMRYNNRFFSSENTAQYFTLTNKEEEEGRYKKKLMGLEGEFVCAYSRDDQYMATVCPGADFRAAENYRNSDINRLNLSAQYFKEKGITMVRMGRHVKKEAKFDNCIDYANKYYDELMDIVLMKDCKFCVGDANGTFALPAVLNRPLVIKNVIPAWAETMAAFPQHPYNLFIFKKYYKKSEHRYLSIKEMMQIDKFYSYDNSENYYLYWKDKIDQMGIEIVENSAEEILDVVIEMNARIDGEWVETAEDIKLQKKYERLLKQHIQQENYRENAMIHAKIGTLFLKKNPFLLDAD